MSEEQEVPQDHPFSPDPEPEVIIIPDPEPPDLQHRNEPDWGDGVSDTLEPPPPPPSDDRHDE